MDKVVVTGGAGFIGSNLAERLVASGYHVTVVDNLATGHEKNLEGWACGLPGRLEFLRADVNDTEGMRLAFKEALYVFHQAAIPSVPRSIADPQMSNAANISGTLSVLVAARDAGVKRVVSASSSSVYGDDANLPKVETRTGKVLSPYALTKAMAEEYCRLFHKIYGLETVCLRYFNVFGPRQDPKSAYAAVIPRFITSMLNGTSPTVYGDGEQTRDFTYVANIIDANWAAATRPRAAGEVFNVGCGGRTSLNQLLRDLNSILGTDIRPAYEPARKGDVRDSLADIGKAQDLLGYSPKVSLREGLERVVEWYRSRMAAAVAPANL